MYATRLRARITGRGRGRLLLYPAYVQDYLDRMTAADVTAGDSSGLELAVTDAFNTRLQDMVSDGILGVSSGVLSQAASLIKAGCFMMGARTLSGSLVPIAADMPAPTNFNFVTGDYNRRLGLPGNVSTKYLNINRTASEDPQNNNHLAIRGSSFPSAFSYYAGTENIHFGWNASAIFSRNNSTGTGSGTAVSGGNFIGTTRSSGSAFTTRSAGVSTTANIVSTTPSTRQLFVFGANLPAGLSGPTGARLSFYSSGRALDLAILDARITALSNAIQAAIAP